jgi:hypothetical protein
MTAFGIKPDVAAGGVDAMTVPIAGSIGTGTHDTDAFGGVVSSSDDSSSAPRAVAADIAACPDDDAGIGAAAQCCVSISAMGGVHATMMGACSSRLNSVFRVICSSVI